MELSEYAGALRRHWMLIVIITLLGGLVGFGVSQLAPRMYKSTSSVFVSTQQGNTTTELVQGSTFTQNLIQSYAQLTKLPSVLDPVITKLDLATSAQDLATSISVDTPLNTVLINITVANGSPAEAARIANAVSSSLAVTAQALSPKAANGSPAITMQQVAEAQPAVGPFTPNTRLSAATGLLIGLILAIVYALGRQILDTRVRTDADLRRISELPLLGRISDRGRKERRQPLFQAAPYGTQAESFRRLAANLQFMNPDSTVRSVVVTSALPHEGKSTTAINLSLALAERYARVLLVDSDLRRPQIAYYCGIEGGVGLTTVLAGSAELAEVIEPWGNIHVLPAGIVPPNPVQLTTSEAMAATVKTLTEDYDIVVFDSAPLLPVSDSLALTRITDGALVVLKSNSTRRGQLRSAVDAVEAVNGHVLGLILNRVKDSKRHAKYGYEPEIKSASGAIHSAAAAPTNSVEEQVKAESSS
ncbi:polysaccharide biosynthesis tyrosine autokinase [Arthrobacter sp. H14-L1]|uniref:polysaccharide biosynthesis tyrosine autokinase n=1 Tax=Arthrobacter sp. H14-L1 TaxID=2996697 RepID=UPI00226E45F9|nr:polysaccharide biosynthesis tyrosine autokinase [Arthrobacter sp. H14-L1]MCY0905728.1 polysaccharide biosynthesis tyrosine autokinase [Arthrobacter sp. H14-L1]